MKYKDLRDFIKQLEKQGELKRITVEVDPVLEMTEICDRTLKQGGPALLFENPKGSKRKGIDPNGNAWEVELNHHYGDLKKTEGADGDPVDVFLSDDAENESHPVFIVDQVDPTSKKFDEHKVMLGFRDEADARQGYLEKQNLHTSTISFISPFSKYELSNNSMTKS